MFLRRGLQTAATRALDPAGTGSTRHPPTARLGLITLAFHFLRNFF
jgi:hypothetical protein